MKIVVSGGAGFIGTHTVRLLLARGHEILVIDDLRHACGHPLPPDVEHIVADVASDAAGQAIERFHPEVILHLAAQGGVSRSVRDPAGDAVVNVVGTVALARRALDSGCRRFVFASSGGAIYGRARRLPSAETSRPQPLAPYGAAKLAAETYLGMFARSFGLRSLCLRYANVYGPWQDGTGEAGVVAINCTRLLEGRPPRINGDGHQTRDFVFVEDVAQANALALTCGLEGSVNIGTGAETSVRQIADHLVQEAGFKGDPEMHPGRPGEVRRSFLNVSRAAQALGWKAHVDLASGLSKTFRAFGERR